MSEETSVPSMGDHLTPSFLAARYKEQTGVWNDKEFGVALYCHIVLCKPMLYITQQPE